MNGTTQTMKNAKKQNKGLPEPVSFESGIPTMPVARKDKRAGP
jgi:hypothetical protein